MATSYRGRFLSAMAQAQRALTQLYADLAVGIIADVQRAADPDGNVPRSATLDLQRRAGDRVTAMFLARNRAGQLAPFDLLANGRVMPLSPYFRVLWAAITDVVRLPVEQNAVILARRLPADVLAVMRRARVNPFAVAREEALIAQIALPADWGDGGAVVVAEQVEVFRPNPLAKYDAPHTWVDPNGYQISDRVWNAAALTRRHIDIYLDEAIRQGRGSLAMSKELEQFLRPDRVNLKTKAPYGTTASYDGMRLARTEITRAHTEATRISAAMNPFVEGIQWVLSPRHPKPDICDDYARGGPNGDGVYAIDAVPGIPHPHCLCGRKQVLIENPDAIIEALRADIRKARQELVDKVGPLSTEMFEALLMGEQVPGVVDEPEEATPTIQPITPEPAPDLDAIRRRAEGLSMDELRAEVVTLNASVRAAEEAGNEAQEERLRASLQVYLDVGLKRQEAEHEQRRQEAERRKAEPAKRNIDNLTIEQFSALVNQAAAGTTTGRFNEEKVFIASVWEKLRSDGVDISLDEFKRRLVEASQQSLITLSRADFQGDQPRALVEASEINRFGATQHYIRHSPRSSRPAQPRPEGTRVDGTRITIEDFAARTLDALNRTPEEARFGDYKVFISSAWESLRADGVDITLDEFKQRLIEANQRRLLTLSRADMAYALDQSLVRPSEFEHMNSTFHFIYLPTGPQSALPAGGALSLDQIEDQLDTVLRQFRAARTAGQDAEVERLRVEAARLRQQIEDAQTRQATREAEERRLRSLRFEPGTAEAARQRLLEMDAQLAPHRAEIAQAQAEYDNITLRLQDATDRLDFDTLSRLARERVPALRRLEALRASQPVNPLEAVYVNTPTNIRLVSDDMQPNWRTGVEEFNRLVSRQVWADAEIRVDVLPDGGRAHHTRGAIHVSRNETIATVIHELAHELEQSSGAQARIREFFERRTQGDEWESLRTLTGKAYRQDEVTKRDRWLHPYMGKYYPAEGITELISMGVEYLYRDPIGFSRDDPEMFDFIYDLVRGR